MRYIIVMHSLTVIGIMTWLRQVFGPHYAMWIGVLLAIPGVILVMIQQGETKRLKREYFYVIVVAVFCMSMSGYLVAEWFDKDQDVAWRWACECQPFVKDVKSDPRFADVEVAPSLVKGMQWINFTGGMKTDDDYNQLEILFEQRFHRDPRHHIDVYYPGKYH